MSEEAKIVEGIEGDVGHWFVDTFKEDLYRSREVKSHLYKLTGKALAEMEAIFDGPTNKETISAKTKLIEFVLSGSIIKTELPRVQREYVGVNGDTTKVEGIGWEPIRMGSGGVRSFLLQAMGDEGYDPGSVVKEEVGNGGE